MIAKIFQYIVSAWQDISIIIDGSYLSYIDACILYTCINHETESVECWEGNGHVINLGKLSNRKLVQIGGGVNKSKKSQVSVGKSSKLGGGSSEIKKVPSSRGYQRLKNNDSFSSYEDPKT